MEDRHTVFADDGALHSRVQAGQLMGRSKATYYVLFSAFRNFLLASSGLRCVPSSSSRPGASPFFPRATGRLVTPTSSPLESPF